MRSLFIAFVALITLLLGFWAYRQNYTTRESINTTREINRQISLAVSELNMLNAEWHYLNRPERLSKLVVANFEYLQLQPMRPDQIGAAGVYQFPEYSMGAAQ